MAITETKPQLGINPPESLALNSSVIAAEDIAKFRIDLEKKVFAEGLKPNEWWSSYQSTLAEYPAIHPYEGLFDIIIEKALNANSQLESVWGIYQSNQELNAGADIVEYANPEAAKELFKRVFNFYAEEPVKAVKGAITLRFMVGENDYRKLRKQQEDEPLDEAFAYFSTDFVFPVLILRKDFPEGPRLYQLVHELEHAKNRLLHLNERYLEGLILPPEILHRLKRWLEDLTRAVEENTKDELLAQFTQVAIENEIESDWGPNEILEKCGQELKSTPQAKESLFRNHYINGVDSLVRLSILYKNLGYQKNAARMTINILAQFPLHHWPAVVKLLETKHKPVLKDTSSNHQKKQ